MVIWLPEAAEVEVARTRRFDAMTVTVEVALAPPCDGGNVAVIVTGPPMATPVTAKVALVCPDAIGALCGTVATAGFEDVRLTVSAVVCGALIVTVIIAVCWG